ncbi:MAG: beta-ketoacyl-ACP synthase II [Calditrichae bacterium]|nr:beta-ketoacyl-ACP synthase II [Calditrichia bacterium]
MEKRRVVITGMGVVTPIGNSIKEFWQGVLAGKSGADLITKFDASQHTTKFACEVKNFSHENILEPKEAKRIDAFSQYAIVAAHEAINDSGIDFEKEDKERIGVLIGSGIGGFKSFEDSHKRFLEGGPRRVSPFFIPQMIIDIASGHVSIRYGLKGPNYGVVSACATASHSIGDAFKIIQRGDAEVMITGGSEAAITPMAVAGFNSMKAISTRNDTPQSASRPFDKTRDGFVMGEGSGIVILEELEHAKKRGARIYAEMRGIGFTADAHHITAPAPGGEGAVRAMKLAITDGGLNQEDVQYINAHGTSTPYNDRSESEAIKTLFGEGAYKLHVSSTKSMVGHLLGAAGGVELIACVLAINEGVVPPTINYQEPDPDCDLNYTPNQPQQREVSAALSNTFGFGGHNAVLAVSSFK